MLENLYCGLQIFLLYLTEYFLCFDLAVQNGLEGACLCSSFGQFRFLILADGVVVFPLVEHLLHQLHAPGLVSHEHLDIVAQLVLNPGRSLLPKL